MALYIVRRVGQSLVVVFLVSVLIFLGMRVVADPVNILLEDTATPAMRAELRERLGLDDPLPVQYVTFFRGILTGEFGRSWTFNQPAMQVVLDRLPASFQLAIAALAVSLILGIPLGVAAAAFRTSRRGRVLDRIALFVSLLGVSVPVFWLAVTALLVFAVVLRWLPTSGRGGLEYMVMPVAVLALSNLALIVRLTRTGMIESLAQDYTRTARAKGMSQRIVLFRHALRNALIPVVTVLGVNFGSTLVYATVVEVVFAWPGIGWLLLQAMSRLDYPVLVAYGIVIATVFATINLVVDISYAFIDPRIRYG